MTFHTWGNSIWDSKEVMRLTSRGRLGINTTSPTELLDVNGNISCSGTITNGSTSYINAGGLRIGGFDYGNTLYQNTVNYDIGISTNNGSTTGGNIKFNTRALTRMTIDGATGNVSCTGDLTVGGSITLYGNILLYANPTTGAIIF